MVAGALTWSVCMEVTSYVAGTQQKYENAKMCDHSTALSIL